MPLQPLFDGVVEKFATPLTLVELFNTTEGIVVPTPGVVKPVIVEVGTDVTFHPYVVPLLISDVSTTELILLPEQIV